MNLGHKKSIQLRRRLRIRKGVSGTADRPRLSLHFSDKHIYAQCIDDTCGHTLAYLSTQSPLAKEGCSLNVAGAEKFGKLFGDVALKAGINKVVFDRDIRRYHGKVKAFADSVREMVVEF